MRIHPPHGKTGACCVLASATVAVIAFFALGIADGSSVSAQAAPVITPVGPITNLAARPYGALLPIVVGPANTPTAAPTPTPVATATPTPPPGAVPAPTPPASPREAAALYHSEYLPALSTDAQSTANVANCSPGTISAPRLAALEKQINYFRRMAGVPLISFDATMSAHAQAAALIMAAEGSLSHDPPTTWRCYSADGATGAGRSDLGLSGGYDTRRSVITFMQDPGSSNVAMGHREWLLAPPTRLMGAGEVQGSEWDAYAVHVVDPGAPYFDPWPAPRDGFVAWPPPGFVPRDVVYPRWSFFLAADFGAASIALRLDGNPVASTIIYAESGSTESAVPGWNGLVWEPALDLEGLDWSTTHRVDVTIREVKPDDGATRAYDYAVLLFAP